MRACPFTVLVAAFHWSFPNWTVHIIIGITAHGQPWLAKLSFPNAPAVGGGLQIQNCLGGHYVTDQ